MPSPVRTPFQLLSVLCRTGAIVCVTALLLVFLPACRRPAVATPLRHQAYLWQRDWTPAVRNALVESEDKVEGLVILASQIDWPAATPAQTAQPLKAKITRPAIDWPSLAALGPHSKVSLALRIGPYNREFAPEHYATRTVCDEVRELLSQAKSAGITLDHFQIDFDCPQKRLSGYAIWLRALHEIIHPIPVVFTALPVWLDEPEFPPLCQIADAWVLQVHSVAIPKGDAKPVLCDPVLAETWMQQAAEISHDQERPFWIALPTYRSYAGVAPDGKVLGIASEGPAPQWPATTRIIEFSPNAADLANLVGSWAQGHPSQLQGIMWYRLPVASDRYNWRWPTLSAVMAGRVPELKLELNITPDNPRDFTVSNLGEGEILLDHALEVTLGPADLISGEALAGWKLERQRTGVLFRPTSTSSPIRLLPGDRRGIGWLRTNSSAPLHAHFLP